MSTLLGQYGLQMRYVHVWMETTQECTSTHTYTHTHVLEIIGIPPPVWVGPWCSQISLGNHQGLKGIQQIIGIPLLCGWGPGDLKWVWATMFLPYTGIQRLVCSQPFFQKWAGDETIQRHPTNIGVPSVWEWTLDLWMRVQTTPSGHHSECLTLQAPQRGNWNTHLLRPIVASELYG